MQQGPLIISWGLLKYDNGHQGDIALFQTFLLKDDASCCPVENLQRNQKCEVK